MYTDVDYMNAKVRMISFFPIGSSFAARQSGCEYLPIDVCADAGGETPLFSSLNTGGNERWKISTALFVRHDIPVTITAAVASVAKKAHRRYISLLLF